ncbi:TetR/AcrR family transcriptional regulator [Streptomyces telluris]|uniref:TetR/AcrR family transcriptional regulator n=1 Tax=Streptomyces telluris TaxID=2720021 RepID=A0A9X2LLA3_9ACTN|nr:TetR/AcrR family transcriptional regulator [Streptomyces telluris]MCQ8772912.1 TetR/AcrR family transcriptional regulator [Streptomyces telluris]NJP81783.1 TetR family transcriptional regulator [Streptomyces telluris]
MPDQHSTLRAQRRAETQRTLQAHAVRLFTERGYDATTVTDVAEAAGMSPMTVYRHFPTKEDLVLVDHNGRLVAERIAASSAAQPLVRRIGNALVDSAATLTGSGRGDEPTASKQFLLARLRLMISTPALRARHLDNHYALQQAIVEALGAGAGDAADPDAAFRAQAAAGACLAAMHTALMRWAEDDGRTELPDLIAKALAAAFGEDLVGTGLDA